VCVGLGRDPVDDLARPKQHADVEQRVDARLRGDEVRDRDAPAAGQHDRAQDDHGCHPADRPQPERIVGRRRDHEDRAEREQPREDEQRDPCALRRRRHDEQQRAPQRRAHVPGSGDQRECHRTRTIRGVGEPAGVAIDHDAVEPVAGDQHQQAVRHLVEPRREQLERVEQEPAERQVPEQQRREQSDRDGAQLHSIRA